ncbi:MAG TPA: hypothetical protein VMU60_06665 [Syntrophobacteria bacterium]|nr:hypothetical protein [Syntrophobacteria bacterium]
MWYFAVVYFNWLPAVVIWGFNRWRKGRVKGSYLVATGSALELLALLEHWREWSRLRGRPDQLYVWILPLLLSIVAVIMIVAGAVRSFLPEAAGDPAADDSNIA